MTGTDHAAVVTGVAAGAGGAALSLLGADAQTMTAALVGCIIGLAAAPPTGRIHAVCLFLAAVCASAEAATWLAPLLATSWPFADVSAWRRMTALAVGVTLHPLASAVSDVVPALVRRFAKVKEGGS